MSMGYHSRLMRAHYLLWKSDAHAGTYMSKLADNSDAKLHVAYIDINRERPIGVL